MNQKSLHLGETGFVIISLLGAFSTSSLTSWKMAAGCLIAAVNESTWNTSSSLFGRLFFMPLSSGRSFAGT